MATPLQPTAQSICKEGLTMGGAGAPNQAKIDRAVDIWLPMLIQEIVNEARQTGIQLLETWQGSAVAICVTNQRRFALPTDYGERMTFNLLDGTHRGTATAGSAQGVTLEDDEDLSESEAEGASILMTSGDSACQYRQIIEFTAAAAPVLAVDRPWDAGKTPASGDGYVIVNDVNPLEIEYIRNIDDMSIQTSPGEPMQCTTFEEHLYFDRPCDKVYGIQVRYYLDHWKVDLTDPRWNRVYSKWAPALTKGIFKMKLDDIADTRVREVTAEFERLKVALILSEKPDHGQFESFALEAV